jgi:hypothetical protein
LAAQPAAQTDDSKLDKKALAAEKKTKAAQAETDKTKPSLDTKALPAITKEEAAKRKLQSETMKAAAAAAKAKAATGDKPRNTACRAWDKDKTCKYGDDCIYDHLTHGGTHKGKPRRVNPRTGSPSGSTTSQKSQSSTASTKSSKAQTSRRTPPASPTSSTRAGWTDAEKGKIACKHHKHGKCNAGDKCLFSHALIAGATLLGNAEGAQLSASVALPFHIFAQKYDDIYASYPSFRNERFHSQAVRVPTLRSLTNQHFVDLGGASSPGIAIMKEMLQESLDYELESDDNSLYYSSRSSGASVDERDSYHQACPIRFGNFCHEDFSNSGDPSLLF